MHLQEEERKIYINLSNQEKLAERSRPALTRCASLSTLMKISTETPLHLSRPCMQIRRGRADTALLTASE